MTKTVIRRRKVEMPGALRKKLTGALAMLVIAAIMMVSSTFAWFTLSTAPEVKGLSTSIGSNGNLEIILLDNTSFPSTAANLGKDSGVGDSIETQGILGNVTWGNLVDLSYSDYGLSNILLLPSALNVSATNTTALGTTMLIGANYGTDGRVDEVKTATAGAVFDKDSNVFVVTEGSAGVRAIGVPSTLSPIAAAFNDARRLYNEAITSAKNIMINSLTASTSPAYSLMGLAATDNGVSAAGFENLNTTIGLLGDANAQVFAAIKEAALMTKFSTLDDATQIATIQSAVAAVTPAADAATLKTTLGTAAGITVTGALADAIDLYYTTAGELADAQTAYDTAHAAGANGTNLTINNVTGQTGYTEAVVRGILDKFLDKTHAEIAEVLNPTRTDATPLINYANTHGLSIPVTLYGGSGVYSDISKNVGTFDTGSISLAGTLYESYNVSIGTSFEKNVIDNGTGADPRYTVADASTDDKVIYLAASLVGLEPSDGTATTQNFSKGLGYALDFGFRTNAATGAKLLLSDPAQRIYNGTNASTNAATQGEGTYLQFTTANTAAFSVDKLKTLMGAIRIVFAEPQFESGNLTGYTILAMGAVDGSVNTTTGILTVADGGGVGTDGYKLPLALYNYTVDGNVADGEPPILKLGEKKDSLEITSLTQNVGKKISVIVYLDGDYVDNTMVANAQASMTGKLNLQFATDAALVPMEDASLRNGTATVDKSALNTALTGADADYATAQTQQGQTVADEFVQAYNAAVGVRDDDDATQADVNAALAALGTAYQAWLDAQQP